MKNYITAAESAITVSEKKDADRAEIFEALKVLISEINQWKEGKITLKLEIKRSNEEIKNRVVGTALGKMLGLDLPESTESVGNNNSTLDYVLKAMNSEKTYQVTEINLSKSGYPCSIYIDGNKETSNDVFAFEQSLQNLMSSVHVGDIFRKLLNQ
ncbi:MAG: hypothetical protein GAK29_00979 [Acinetobacter bereziniae]|uniref:Uncharacterized protein n=1 Tax=Acinetobacter bereziniae TaxID=106648 RepID=A0A833PHH0_ACIBZ|nr:MAG: hypothetical protein GAK29_00979 [Acinetobacter bereziniae]